MPLPQRIPSPPRSGRRQIHAGVLAFTLVASVTATSADESMFAGAAPDHDRLRRAGDVPALLDVDVVDPYMGIDITSLAHAGSVAVAGAGVLVIMPPITIAPLAILSGQPETGEAGGVADEDAEAVDAPSEGPDRGAAGREMTPELDAAVARGLAWLARQQNDDGSFGEGGRYSRNVGITSLCAIAFMAAGHMPERGQYGPVVDKALNFVLNCSSETGLIAADRTSHGPMYGHGFATLFLGEIYGMGGGTEDPRLREALVKAVRLIVNTQNAEGGWRYNPVPDEADVSVTICQVMALRSARNAGIRVPKETIDRAVAYVQRCQNPDGGFRYMTMPGESLWPRSAAGVATLYYAGIYEDQSITRGLGYLNRNAMPGPGRPETHYHYGNYYTAQAMFLAGGEEWDRFWPAMRTELLTRQDRGAGFWQDPYTGGPYGTAMSLIVLQMPKRYLPIFQR